MVIKLLLVRRFIKTEEKKSVAGMTMMSKTAIGIAAGICGTIFLGYCIYFDRQRRSDPNFKKKLKERE